MSLFSRIATVALACAAVLVLAGLPPTAEAARKKKEEPVQQENQPDFSTEFRKNGGKVQENVTAQKWPEVLEGVAMLEALPDLTYDDKRVILSWKLQAQQSTGDREGLMATLEQFLQGGFATPEQIGPMNQQLAAWYNGKKDMDKTLLHYRAFIEATPDAAPDELATMGRLYLQTGNNAEGITWLNKAIDASVARGEVPDEVLFQLLDRAYIDVNDPAGRLNNLEGLVKRYPKSEYYSRILAIYAQGTQDDRTLMLNTYRLANADGGLSTVGEYLGYADTALTAGSPGEARRAMEKGMAAGVVPSAGSNQEILQEAKVAVARDQKDLPRDAQTAAKNPKGEVDVKIGLGYYSLGEWNEAVEAVKRGLAKGGVKRVDDANMLLGASLVELGKYDEAKQAFGAAAAAAGSSDYMRRLAGLWTAYADRKAGGSGSG